MFLANALKAVANAIEPYAEFFLTRISGLKAG
jgi:hypothetical protein